MQDLRLNREEPRKRPLRTALSIPNHLVGGMVAKDAPIDLSNNSDLIELIKLFPDAYIQPGVGNQWFSTGLPKTENVFEKIFDPPLAFADRPSYAWVTKTRVPKVDVNLKQSRQCICPDCCKLYRKQQMKERRLFFQKYVLPIIRFKAYYKKIFARCKLLAERKALRLSKLENSVNLDTYNKFELICSNKFDVLENEDIEFIYSDVERPKSHRKRRNKKKKVPIYMGHIQPDAHGNEQGVTSDVADNVAIQKVTATSIDIPVARTSAIKELSCSETNQQFVEAAARWTVGDGIEWNVSQTPGTILKAYSLPFDFVNEYKSMEQMLPFRVFQYWNGDIEFKLTLAASPFIIGQLQIAWFYGPQYDVNFQTFRLCNQSMSVTNHVLLSAAQANEAVLKIPYKAFRPWLNTKIRSDQDDNLRMGRVYIMVLNQLSAPDSVNKQVYLIPHVRFPNSGFQGMVSSDYGTFTGHILGEIAAMTALSMVNSYLNANKDKPTNVLDPMPLVPVATSSLASGKNARDINDVFRISPNSFTPHPSGATQEMTIDYVKNIFGFVKSIKWTIYNQMSSRLISFDAAPCWEMNSYHSIVLEATNCYYLPPVAVLSQMFAYWRGSLEYRFDIVATKFHVGKLLVAYIPNAIDDPTYKQARASACTEFTLQEGNCQFSMTVPYIGDRPFWPRRYSSGVKSDEQRAPGRVCIFSMTPLSRTNSVSSSIYINVYVRGGPDFEVAIPSQPSIGLSNVPYFDNSKPSRDNTLYSKEGYFPIYVGTYRNFVGSQKAIFRYGTVTDQVAQFTNAKHGWYYRASSNINQTQFYVSGKPVKLKDYYFVPVNVDDGNGFIYLGVVSSETAVREYWAVYSHTQKAYVFRGDWKNSMFVYNPDRSKCLTISSTSSNEYTPTGVQPIFDGTDLGLETPPEPTPEVSLEQYDIVEGQGERDDVITSQVTIQQLGPQNGSLLQFGEPFSDLTDICRRFMHYGHVSVVTKRCKFEDGALFRFPVLPQGLNIEPDKYSFDNLTRDGIIPIVASGYRFYRGGIRFKIFSTLFSGNLWVQHRPDRKLSTKSLTPAFKTDTDKQYLHGYASNVQTTAVNNCLQFEIPFYQPGEFGLLQEANIDNFNNEVCMHYSLGDIAIGVITDLQGEMNVEFNIFYSISDDMSFSTFQGFPPMVLLNESQRT